MEFGKNRWKALGFELRNVKHDRSKALWKASALIGAVVVGMVMETLRRRSKTLRRVKPEVSVERGRVRVSLRKGRTRARRTSGIRASRRNGSRRMTRVSRAIRSAVRT